MYFFVLVEIISKLFQVGRGKCQNFESTHKNILDSPAFSNRIITLVIYLTTVTASLISIFREGENYVSISNQIKIQQEA